MIKISNVSKTYVTDNREVKALNNINIEFPDYGMVFILGKSGSGKTTLMNMMGGFNRADTGKIYYIDNNKKYDVLQMNYSEQEKYRNLVLGYVFQDFNLLNNCNVEENIRFVLEQQSIGGKTAPDIDDKIRKIIKYVDLEGMKKSRISELSGGQIQRVAIARALVKEPNIILADEPTGNLDYKTSLKIMDLLKNISKQCLVVIVTHDESLANMFGDKIIYISDGEVVGETDKSDTKISYKISIKDNISGELTDKIFNSRKNVMQYMEKIIFKEKLNDINIVCEETEKSEQCNKVIFESEEKNDKRLSWKRLFKFAYLNYSEYKVKNIVNIIVMGFIFGIICFFGSLIFSDKTKSETRYIAQNSPNVVLCENKEYEDSFGNIKENIVYKSEDILQLAHTIGTDKITECFSGVEIEFGEKYISADIWIDYQDYSLISGAKPEKGNEICITDYQAKLLDMDNECIGSTISIFGVDFFVTGIIKTDYHERDIINRMNNGKITLKEYDEIKYVYQRCVCSEKIISYIAQASEAINICASDFTLKGIASYVNSNIAYTSVSNLSGNDHVIYGRMPEEPKEIAVSYEFAVINDMLTEDGYECKKEWRFVDIYDEAYNGAYDNYVNMYDYLNGFTVVGIIENNEDVYKSELILCNEDYNNIRESFFQKRKDMLVFNLKGTNFYDLKKMLIYCQKKGITIDESVVQIIDGFFESKDNIWYLLGAIMLVFVTILLMMNISGISDNVDTNKKNIGILKALGVKKKSIHNIFYIQDVLAVLFIEIIGVISLIIINSIVNMVINAKVETNGVCFAGVEYRFMIIVLFSLFAINIFCVNKVMRKVDKVPIISLLKK